MSQSLQLADTLPLVHSKRERSSAESRRRILEAAELEFAAKGFDGARLANVARVAGVQQALIHHYFQDKAGLYREVVDRALEAMTNEGWDILSRLAPPKKRGRKRFTEAEIETLVRAFADLLVRFYSEHASLLAILRHEAERDWRHVTKFVEAGIKEQFDDICERLEEMKRRGEIRRDVSPRHLCVSAVAMACFPFTERQFLTSVWHITIADPSFHEERKREIAETILSRIVPRR